MQRRRRERANRPKKAKAVVKAEPEQRHGFMSFLEARFQVGHEFSLDGNELHLT